MDEIISNYEKQFPNIKINKYTKAKEKAHCYCVFHNIDFETMGKNIRNNTITCPRCKYEKSKYNLVGQKFERWNVIGRDYSAPSGNKKRARWLCICDCQLGKSSPQIISVDGSNLKSGFSKSCGCYNLEQIISRNKIDKKKENIFDLSGEYGIGYDARGNKFLFDIEDYEKIKQYYWLEHNGYFITTDGINMHRFVMDVKDDELVVDHIYHNRNDNRKSKLRITTQQQNAINSSIKRNNSSGVTGVVWNKNNKNWRAMITFNGKRDNLGSFKIFEDAVNARKNAELRYFGEYAYKEETVNE